MTGIISIDKPLLIIVSFEEGGMALAEMLRHIFAGLADVGKHPYPYIVAFYYKVVRVAGVVQCWKWCNPKPAHLYGLVWPERYHQMWLHLYPCLLQG